METVTVVVSILGSVLATMATIMAFLRFVGRLWIRDIIREELDTFERKMNEHVKLLIRVARKNGTSPSDSQVSGIFTEER